MFGPVDSNDLADCPACAFVVGSPVQSEGLSPCSRLKYFVSGHTQYIPISHHYHISLCMVIIHIPFYSMLMYFIISYPHESHPGTAKRISEMSKWGLSTWRHSEVTFVQPHLYTSTLCYIIILYILYILYIYIHVFICLCVCVGYATNGGLAITRVTDQLLSGMILQRCSWGPWWIVK